jgi:hypothetical protein
VLVGRVERFQLRDQARANDALVNFDRFGHVSALVIVALGSGVTGRVPSRDLEHDLAGHVLDLDHLEGVRHAIEGEYVLDLHGQATVVIRAGELREPIPIGRSLNGFSHRNECAGPSLSEGVRVNRLHYIPAQEVRDIQDRRCCITRVTPTVRHDGEGLVPRYRASPDFWGERHEHP